MLRKIFCKRIVFIFLIVLLVCDLVRFSQTSFHLSQPLIIYLAPNMRVRHVISDLSKQQVWQHSRDAVYFAVGFQLLKMRYPIKAGEYLLKPPMKYVSLWNVFRRGKLFLRKITFIEGQRFQEMRRILLHDTALRQTLRDKTDAMLIQELFGLLPSLHVSPEGLFFPDTYKYYRGESDRMILTLAYRKMQTLLSQVWERRQPGLPYKTPYEMLIMASLVEAEAHVPSERARIAGVFIRRLEKKMRLQCDPTVSYGLGYDAYHKLTKHDLQTVNIYNTYLILGLPPTPILMPGLAAIQAAAQPMLSDELYFVARGDGSHVFSTTLEKHNAAVDQYIRKKKY